MNNLLIKQIERTLYELEEKPQFGFPLSFDVGKLQERLQTLFGRPSLKIEYTLKGWVSAEELYEGVGEGRLPLKLDWAPLHASAYFLTTDQDLKHLMTDLLDGEERSAYFYDLSLVQGFYHYFACEMLHALQELEFAPPLSPRIGEMKGDELPDEPAFVIDLSLSLDGCTFWGRVLLPESFRNEWKHFFAGRPPPALPREALEKITVDVDMEVGHTSLTLGDWNNVEKGDFILLDHCSYDPESRKGGVLLSLNQTPLFRGRFKENGIKLTEYPTYEEVSMEEEETLYGDELPVEEEEETLEGELAPEEPTIKPEELPIQLTVEVGRLRMTAQELMQLTPGNLIEMNVAPEQGVDLVVNGKKVGRGELIRLGETLGVRILSL